MSAYPPAPDCAPRKKKRPCLSFYFIFFWGGGVGVVSALSLSLTGFSLRAALSPFLYSVGADRRRLFSSVASSPVYLSRSAGLSWCFVQAQAQRHRHSALGKERRRSEAKKEKTLLYCEGSGASHVDSHSSLSSSFIRSVVQQFRPLFLSVAPSHGAGRCLSNSKGPTTRIKCSNLEREAARRKL